MCLADAESAQVLVWKSMVAGHWAWINGLGVHYEFMMFDREDMAIWYLADIKTLIGFRHMHMRHKIGVHVDIHLIEVHALLAKKSLLCPRSPT